MGVCEEISEEIEYSGDILLMQGDVMVIGVYQMANVLIDDVDGLNGEIVCCDFIQYMVYLQEMFIPYCFNTYVLQHHYYAILSCHQLLTLYQLIKQR